MLFIIVIGLLLILRFGFHISIIELIKAIPFIVKDIYIYFKEKKYLVFDKFGLELFTGKFGNGKTLQMVKMARKLHKRYPGIPVYSNVEIKDIKNLIPLTNFQQIVDIKDKAIVVIDEAGVMFNCRDYGDFPRALLDNILQCRHLGILFLISAQKYEDIDLILRKNISWIHETRKLCGRLLTYDSYDGYRVYYSNIDYHNLKPDIYGIFNCVVDNDRNCYDTTALAVNITNVISDEQYTNAKTAVNAKSVSRYKKKYNGNKWSV